QNGFLKMLSQPVAHIVEALRRVANPKLRNRLRIQSAPGQILTRTRRLGRLQRLLKVLRRRFVDLHQLPALARIPGLFGRMKLLLRQRHPNLLCDRPHCLRKAEAVHLHDERKNVAGLVAPEAVIKPLRHIHRKAARLLLMKWAQAREVLRPRLAQLHIVADDANNVGLVLYLLRETISHGRLTSLVLLKMKSHPPRRNMHLTFVSTQMQPRHCRHSQTRLASKENDMIFNRPLRIAARLLMLAAAVAVPVAMMSATPARAEVVISVGFGPPALPVYAQPICPGDGYLWTPGYWAYGPDGYYWVPGVWVRPPQVGYLWTPGYWGWGGSAFIFHAGYWGPHVGFYGGINYGFGYGGVGYEGGYWRGGGFYYNRTVNNINIVNVHNVYEHPVEVRNAQFNHVSYNGGTGGIP